ncbi:TYR3-like protein [Mya arenaria]|uniref:TYR3-like protein n=2 Tax=Mya arenaria TaxID=6604 RepID=A0ABY7E8M5_MYAAR|nr:TYR3-like protein [Mya arenaria]
MKVAEMNCGSTPFSTLRFYKYRQRAAFSAYVCKMWIRTVLGLLSILVSVQWCAARIEPLTYLPPDLQGYFDTCHSTGNFTTYPGEIPFWASMQLFVCRFVQHRQLSSEETRFVYNTIGSSLSPLYGGQRRVKRQASTPPRIRKEVRAMTIPERVQYFNALNRLKHDRRLRPNIYDVLSSFHEGDLIALAHFGPAFPGWHRLYLWLFESFLRLYNPRVTIPYWASHLDNDMDDSRQSVIFSDAFFGPGVGPPTSGPFRSWQTANPNTVFTRAIGNGGLYTYDGIQRILIRTRNRDILIPTAQADSNFEMQHGAAHVYVGGSMNNLNEATRDPIFFSHHCFVDQIWERFRFGQRVAGVPTQSDYPWDPNDPRFRPGHNPDGMMGFFPAGELNIDFTQRTGYSDLFFSLVQYEPVPSCPRCGDSPYLWCNRRLNPARCVSRTTAEMRTSNRDLVDNMPGLLPTGSGTVAGRKKRQVTQPTDQVCSKLPFIDDYDVNTMSNNLPNSWAYVPVKVVTKRPVNFHGFQKYSLYGVQNNNNGLKNVFVTPGNYAGYSTCNKRMSEAGKVKIVAYGLNHYAYSQEYVITDNRLGISESSGVIQVKMPAGTTMSDVMVAAFDECGRVCRPYCKQGTSMTHNGDEGFSGGIRVSAQSPTQYSSSYGDALLGMWNIPSQNSCPSIDLSQVPLSFFCDYTDAWLWDSVNQSPRGVSRGSVPQKIHVRQGSGRQKLRQRPPHGIRPNLRHVLPPSVPGPHTVYSRRRTSRSLIQ